MNDYTEQAIRIVQLASSQPSTPEQAADDVERIRDRLLRADGLPVLSVAAEPAKGFSASATTGFTFESGNTFGGYTAPAAEPMGFVAGQMGFEHDAGPREDCRGCQAAREAGRRERVLQIAADLNDVYS